MTIRRALPLLVLLGCGGAAEPEGTAPEVTTGAALTATSWRGTFEARVTPHVAEIPLNDPFDVTLVLVDPQTGEAYTDYDAVTIDARMPAHGHGMLRDVELAPQDDGSLLAEGMQFHMIGHWVVHVDVRRGARTERAQISVNLEY